MSTSDKDINRLTGKLLKEGMVKPSPDLSQQPAGSVDHMLEGIKDKLPFIMTIAAIAGSLIFYSALDKVLALRF